MELFSPGGDGRNKKGYIRFHNVPKVLVIKNSPNCSLCSAVMINKEAYWLQTVFFRFNMTSNILQAILIKRAATHLRTKVKHTLVEPTM